MARFDNFIANKDKGPQSNGHKAANTVDSPASSSNIKSETPPPSKKHKHDNDEEATSEAVDSPKPQKKRRVSHDSDAAYAAKLQAMENSRMRSTRGGGTKKSSISKKRSPKKKSAGRVKAEDDSDLEGSGSGVKEKKVNRNTGFHVSLLDPTALHYITDAVQKEWMLSPPLSALLDNEIKACI